MCPALFRGRPRPFLTTRQYNRLALASSPRSIDTGAEITNITVQEVCAMKPDLTSLNLSQCR